MRLSRRLSYLALALAFTAPPALACPPSGCVEVMAAPEGENWGYRQDITEPNGLYVGAAVTSVEVMLDYYEEDSGYRIITVEMEVTDDSFDIENAVEYFFVVKEYDSTTHQLLNTSEEVILLSSKPTSQCAASFTSWDTCAGNGWPNPWSVMCFAGSCGSEQVCPTPASGDGDASYCYTTSAGCQGYAWPGGGGYGSCSCSKFSTTYASCPTAQTIAELRTFWDLCPITRDCVIDVQARGSI